MKKQRWNILKDTIKSKKRDFLFYIPIVIFSATLFSLCLFFISGNTIETNLANSLDMRLSFKNEGFYSKESENSLFASDADLNQNITQIFMMDLDQLCKDDNLEYSNYNLAIDTIVQTSTTNTENYLYGLKDIEYFEKNGIQLEDCYANELVEGTVILPIRAKQEGIKIGDVYTIVDPFNQNSKNVELQVIGFYEDNRWALSSEDTVIKTSPAIVRNSTIFSLLEKYPYYYGMYDEKTGMVVSPIEIVNITFSAKNIEGYSRFVEKFRLY